MDRFSHEFINQIEISKRIFFHIKSNGKSKTIKRKLKALAVLLLNTGILFFLIAALLMLKSEKGQPNLYLQMSGSTFISIAIYLVILGLIILFKSFIKR